MAPSKKNASDIDSDIDSDVEDDHDKPLPPTNEDTFNNIFRGATTLPPRIRNKPQRHGESPTPPLPLKKKTTTKTKYVPLANSALTNQSTKKRSRPSAKSVTAAKLALIRAHVSSSTDHAAVSSLSRHVGILPPTYYTPADSNPNGSLHNNILPEGALLS